jgi:hypothetical protein
MAQRRATAANNGGHRNLALFFTVPINSIPWFIGFLWGGFKGFWALVDLDNFLQGGNH